MAPCQTMSAYGSVLQVYCDVSSRDKLSIQLSNPLTSFTLLCQMDVFFISVFFSDEILIYNFYIYLLLWRIFALISLDCISYEKLTFVNGIIKGSFVDFTWIFYLCVEMYFPQLWFSMTEHRRWNLKMIRVNDDDLHGCFTFVCISFDGRV